MATNSFIAGACMAMAMTAAGVASLNAATDYSSLNGLQGAALKEAVKQIALPHTEISYGDKTWDAFATTDVRIIYDASLGEENGYQREAWFDMYSNRLVWVSTGHEGMNIEHSVANSWWGGKKNAAYKDLHHLNPSDADANNRKNNNPLGIIAGVPTWSNGLTNIGRPTAATGGGASAVFEPADEYKGDFARAYFYVFTVYDNIEWQAEPACMYDLTAYPTLKPWAYEMLLQWAAADPVDEREAARNAAVAEIQKNENPFVAIPGLADYIWGEKRNVPFNLTDAQSAPVQNRLAAPNFSWSGDFNLAGVNTWTGRWWNAFSIYFDMLDSEDAYYSISSSMRPDEEPQWTYLSGVIKVPAASQPGEVLTIKAYTTRFDDPDRRSSISTLTLTAVEEGTIDYMHAKWQKVTDAADINSDDQYIIVSSKANAVMSATTGSTSASGYMSVAGNAQPDDEGIISNVPEGTAVVEFVEAGGNQYYVEVNNLALEPQGFLYSPEAKRVQLAQQGMPTVVSLTPEKNVKIDFGSVYGTLQYNASSPRFSVYTSNQQAVNLYRCIGIPTSGVTTPVDVPAVNSKRIFTLEGIEMKMTEQELPNGLYIIITPAGSRKVMIGR
ncbi:MAG: endonuclease [Muribaculaceae bacterium]|nr:endonuclease [Muribaculaceae bacterium]